MRLDSRTWLLWPAVSLCLLGIVASGCTNPNFSRRVLRNTAHIPPPPAKSGAATEAIWRRQEQNAEAADFIIYEHDFEAIGSVRLNDAGIDHLKQIASRLLAGAPFPVIIERSKYSTDPRVPATDIDRGIFNYEIHPDPELDNRRRDIIARVLADMGVPHANQRVVVGRQLAPSQNSQQAAQAYQQFLAPPVTGLGRGFGPQGFGFGAGFGFGGGPFF